MFVVKSHDSKVYLCKRRGDTEGGSSLLVLKQIPVDEMSIDERKASETEAKVLDMLKHPNIIAYFESFIEDNSIMIAMEYAPGTAPVTVIIKLTAPSPLLNFLPISDMHIFKSVFCVVLVVCQLLQAAPSLISSRRGMVCSWMRK